MVNYCTVDEILSVAPIFKKDVVPEQTSATTTKYDPNSQVISRDEIEDIATEASEMVRAMLLPHYDPEVIDSYDPAFPPVVNFLTKTYGARLMYERYPAIDPSKVGDYLATLDRDMQAYRQIICGQALRDVLGKSVATASGPSISSPGANYAAFDALKV